MKKIIFICCLVILTGCSSKDKKLNCKLTKNIDGNDIVQTVDAFFKNGKISNISMKHEMTLNEENTKYLEIYRNKIDEQFKAFKDKNGITVNLNETDSVITLDVSVDVLKLDEESTKVIGFSISGSYDKSKESFENDGYSCN